MFRSFNQFILGFFTHLDEIGAFSRQRVHKDSDIFPVFPALP